MPRLDCSGAGNVPLDVIVAALREIAAREPLHGPSFIPNDIKAPEGMDAWAWVSSLFPYLEQNSMFGVVFATGLNEAGRDLLRAARDDGGAE